MTPMLEFSGGSLPTPTVEIERCTVTAAQIEEFLRRIDPEEAAAESPPRAVPITFSLALRREHGSGVTISPRAFAIHGGHDIESHSPLWPGHRYVVSASVEEIFEKTGRSGAMMIVVRRVWIHEDSGRLAATIRDRQIVRWRPDAPPAAYPRRAPPPDPLRGSTSEITIEPGFATDLDLGSVIGPFRRRGPTAEEISRWADTLRDREVLFHDPIGSRQLGYADLVVPGPMQSAITERLLSQQLPNWRAVRLDMTFRQSLLATDPMAIQGVVVDSDDDRRICDIIIRHAATGETTSAGTMTLLRRRD